VSDLGACFGFKSNFSRLPTSNSNLIKQKTLNSTFPPTTELPPFGKEGALSVNERSARTHSLKEVNSMVVLNVKGAKL